MASNSTATSFSSSSLLRLSGIVEESIVDGPGLRLVVFVQGCPHHCVGCHNPQTHSFTDGYEKNIDDIFAMYQENPLLAGITFSGGEPFCQPAPLAALGQKVKAAGKTVMTYTGYVYEDLLVMAKEATGISNLLSVTDLLVDGPYMEEHRDLELLFRGSSNQRILKKTKENTFRMQENQ